MPWRVSGPDSAEREVFRRATLPELWSGKRRVRSLLQQLRGGTQAGGISTRHSHGGATVPTDFVDTSPVPELCIGSRVTAGAG